VRVRVHLRLGFRILGLRLRLPNSGFEVLGFRSKFPNLVSRDLGLGV